jgi:2'-5' RNA ligase
MQSTSPFILTLKLDPLTFEKFNALRQQHFPPERNFIPAHITLFHALPPEQHSSISGTLKHVCSETPRLRLYFPTPRFLGRGVSIDCSSSGLTQLQQALAKSWKIWLTSQDHQKYRPHITLQNKVAPEKSRQLYESLILEWQSFTGYGEGLFLWHYRGGPWELAEEFTFTAKPLTSTNVD